MASRVTGFKSDGFVPVGISEGALLMHSLSGVSNIL
jgi:hypothetical protein